MKRKVFDCMIDLETYDNICTAAIASIGAVKFNIATRELSDEFYVTVDPKSCKNLGLSFGKETLEWWKKQSPEARAAIRKDNISILDALQQFHDWISDSGKICAWGMFDIPILDHAFHKAKMTSPWKYWNTVECRSISDLIGAKIDRTTDVHHNALVDAKVQALHMINILNPLEKSE